MAEALSQVPIPAWQQQQLAQLSAAGQLSSVDPLYLALIDQAESSGEVAGAGVNSSGYGGYFGLGAGTQYPGGSVSRQVLLTNSPASFDQQAEVAASEFASLLSQHGGNPIAAEEAYQGGSQEGATIFEQAGVGGSATPGTQASTLGYTTSTQGLNLNPLDAFGVPQEIMSYATRALIALVGAALIIGGLFVMAHSAGESHGNQDSSAAARSTKRAEKVAEVAAVA